MGCLAGRVSLGTVFISSKLPFFSIFQEPENLVDVDPGPEVEKNRELTSFFFFFYKLIPKGRKRALSLPTLKLILCGTFRTT
jgi:hypothetical protein